jgi:TonB family protein
LQAKIVTEQLDCTAALNLIVGYMAEFARASGAAIALAEEQGVVCRARVGNAPDVGVILSPNSLSGLCFKNGTTIMMEDSETDGRVNPEVYRQLNFRSLMVLPVSSNGKVMGIAEVLSPAPGNFSGADILVLSFLCDLIATAAGGKTDDPPVVDAPAEAPTVQAQTHSESLSRLPENVSHKLNPAVKKPVASSAVRHAFPASATPAPALTGQQVPAARSNVLILSPRTVRPQFTERVVPAWFSWKVFLGLLALCAAILIAGYLLAGKLRAAKPASTMATPARAPAERSAVPETTVPVSKLLHERGSSSASEAKRGDRQEVSWRGKATSSAKPAAQAVLRVSQSATARSTASPETSAPETPTIALKTNFPSALPDSVLGARTATPNFQAQIQSQGVTGGRLLKKVLPSYPQMALRAGIGGDVVCTATIGTDGKLRNIQVLNGSPMLRDVAIEAAKQWQYEPYKLNGKTVEADTRITISFHR